MTENNPSSQEGKSLLNAAQWASLSLFGVENIEHLASLVFDQKTRGALLELPEFNEETLNELEDSLKELGMEPDPSTRQKFANAGMGCRFRHDEGNIRVRLAGDKEQKQNKKDGTEDPPKKE